MKFRITENTSSHGFEIGTIVQPARHNADAEHAFAWVDYAQVLLQDNECNAWWVGLDEFEIVK